MNDEVGELLRVPDSSFEGETLDESVVLPLGVNEASKEEVNDTDLEMLVEVLDDIESEPVSTSSVVLLFDAEKVTLFESSFVADAVKLDLVFRTTVLDGLQDRDTEAVLDPETDTEFDIEYDSDFVLASLLLERLTDPEMDCECEPVEDFSGEAESVTDRVAPDFEDSTLAVLDDDESLVDVGEVLTLTVRERVTLRSEGDIRTDEVIERELLFPLSEVVIERDAVVVTDATSGDTVMLVEAEGDTD